MSKKKKLKKQRPVPVQIHNPRREQILNRAIIGMAIAGIAVSGYLTYLQFSHATAAFCAEGSDCDIVRSSVYSHLFGIPVALIGVLGYIAILVVSLWPAKPESRKLPALLLSLAGFTFAAYLTFLEFAVIKAVCLYCVVSFLLITGIFIASLIQKPIVPKLTKGKLVLVSIIIVALVLVISIPAQFTKNQEPAESDFQTRLAKHITSQGATVYGAYWCPHCADQKELFGKAFSYVNYVECDPKGANGNPQLCKAKGVKVYPTWEINGKLIEGVLSLSQLAELTGFSP